MRISSRRGAALAIFALVLAQVRTLAEIHRLHSLRTSEFALTDSLPYVDGAITWAIGIALAVLCYMLARYRLAIAIAVSTILIMIVYKVMVIGG